VLEKDLDGPVKAIRAKSAKRLPTVLTRQEALAVIERLSDTYRLAAQLLYGSGLRLMECGLATWTCQAARLRCVIAKGPGIE